MDIKKEIIKYSPFDEQEKSDKEIILSAFDTFKDISTRKNKIAHLTSSAWVINEQRNKVLFVYHNIYNSWSWAGGHADGENDLLNVALKEVYEETGVSAKPLKKEIFSLEILTVNSHYKKNMFVSSHLHLNLTYLLSASESDILRINEDENSDVRWFGFDEALKASSEEDMKKIYLKLNKKVKELT